MFRMLMNAFRNARLRAGRRHAYRRLDSMDDRMLTDIGVTRADLDRAIRMNDAHFAKGGLTGAPIEERRYTAARSTRRGEILVAR